jgi:hypothetical protein
MALLTTTLENKLITFGEVGGFNSDVGSKEKPRENESLEKGSRKDPKKEKLRHSFTTSI